MKRKPLITTLLLAFSFSVFSPIASIAKAEELPKIPSTESAITMDYETGEIIYAKNADEKRYPASTTKLLTGLLFAENKQKTDKIAYSEEAKKQPQYSLNTNFKPQPVGSTMTADDVMKALLLYSANDAAYMVADAVSGNSKAFSDLMNKKAKEIGMNNSHFITPNGLHNPDHYSTAYDLTILGRDAFKNPWEREVMETKKSRIILGDGSIIYIENRNLGLGIDGNLGGKTGTTTEAGHCLVAVYERNGKKIVGTVLNAPRDNKTVFEQMNKIMDYSYSAKRVPIYKTGYQVKKIDLKYKPFGFFGPEKTIQVPLDLTEDVMAYDNPINKEATKLDVATTNVSAWKLATHNDMLKLTVKERIYHKNYNLKANISIWTLIKANLVIYVISLVVIVAIVVLIILIINLIKKGRSRKRSGMRFR